jgi:hypothetical protein
MGKEDTSERKYKTTSLPTLSASQGNNRELLLKLYQQVSANWRQLTEVRFHLLAIVPTVSILLIATVLSEEGPAKGLSVFGRVAIAAIGSLVTVSVDQSPLTALANASTGPSSHFSFREGGVIG